MPPSSLQPSQLRWHRPLTDAGRSRLELPSPRGLKAANSYGQILSSSVVIGGSSLVTMLAALVRNKVVAVFLGPAGVGLMSLFNAMTSVVGSFVGLGISTSGVREISEAAGADDPIRLARSVTVVRRILVRLGILGAALLAAFSRPISRLTFGSADHARDVLLLSAVVLAGAVADGQAARLQGFRRMGDLARAAVLGTILTLTLTVPIVYFWRQDAVVALLLVASGATLASSWWYARKIQISPVRMTWRETLHASRPLLHLGLASMSSALMVAGIGYVVRVMIARSQGVDAAGIFQSATALSGVYCGFILSAMGADFLPRVSAVAQDDATCNRLVNEQAEVGLLLAFPGICATLAFSPLIVSFLYSPQFGLAAEVLRWQVLGVFLRVASWPMGYLLIAKGKAQLYFWTELSYNLLYAGLIWICVRLWALPGTGIAFFGLYIYYGLMMCVVTRRLSGFAWSSANKRIASVATPTVAFVFLCPSVFPAPWQFVAASAATMLAGLYSLRLLLLLPGNQGLQALAARIPLGRVWRPLTSGMRHD